MTDEVESVSLRLTPKFDRWQQLYLEKNNKVTFGNATQSALIAYNLDPQTQYASASQIGYENLRKLENLRSTVHQYLEQNGFTLPVLINHALEKLADPRVTNDRWWKNILVLAGYIEPKQSTTINNANNAIANSAASSDAAAQAMQIDPQEQHQLSQDFEEFIDNKYKGKPAMNPDNPTGTNR